MKEAQSDEFLSLLSTKLGQECSDITSRTEERRQRKLLTLLCRVLDKEYLEDVSASTKVFSLRDDVSVVISPQAMVAEIQVRKTVWHGPGDPIPTAFPTAVFDLVNLDVSDAVDLIYKAAKAIRRSRRSSYQKCRFCGKRFAPEHMYGKGACHGCASEQWHIDY